MCSVCRGDREAEAILAKDRAEAQLKKDVSNGQVQLVVPAGLKEMTKSEVDEHMQKSFGKFLVDEYAQKSDGVNPKDRVGATKPPLSLVPPVANAHCAMAMSNGAAKYGPYNWRSEKVQSMIYLDAAKRHIDSFIDGEELAKDSGVHHLAHAMACCAILLDAFEGGWVKDNRPLPGNCAEVLARLTKKK